MMYIFANVIAFFSIFISYALVMALLQNLFSLVCSSMGIRATRKLASRTMFVSAGTAAAFSIYGCSFVLSRFGYQLSIIPVILWSVLQITGIAKSVFDHSEDITEEMLVLTGAAEVGAVRFKYIGQFYGTLVGIILGTVAHYL